jgi:cytochrome oxidase Cu insertion factor (SCO1/SenC/PrrC family)/thiol-disulfide isomerase/thioredoxin
VSESTPVLVGALSGRTADSVVTGLVAAAAVLVACAWGARRWLRARQASGSGGPGAAAGAGQAGGSRLWLGAGALFAVPLVAVAILLTSATGSGSGARRGGLARNPQLDPGTPLSRPAPDFTLTDQFGRSVSLSSFRGKVVILAFNDSECTTICPLTTTAMLDAKAMLGSAGAEVALVGVDANPTATAVHDVWSYSELHGMLHSWSFLTGPVAKLRRVWHDYYIDEEIEHGQIDHTPALFVISPSGIESRLYLTKQSYSAVGQLGQLLAQEASRLLPGHPKVRSDLSYAAVPVISPRARTELPAAAGSGTVPLGPGQPRLQLFFATWDSQVTDLARQLDALNGYQAAARAAGLPQLTAVDEASVEPSSAAVTSFLSKLPAPLSYPVVLDRSGRVADGYEVQDEPWYVLTSASGRILWFWDVSTSGWLGEGALATKVKAAVAKAAQQATNAAAAARALSDSPAPLASLHDEAGQLLGGESQLAARLRSLRGYPVVVNIWASWCGPCRAEFALFAKASLAYGRKVAFLGANYNDNAGSAKPFLAQHPVSYPSYQAQQGQLNALTPGGIANLPITVILNRSGKVVHINTGEYLSQGSLNQDIESYALGGA